MVDAGRIAHHGEAVTILQSQVIGGKKANIATEHTAHIHAIGVAHGEMAQQLAVQPRTGHHDDAALHLGIDGVPVHLLAVPVLVHLLAEENRHGRNLILIGYHQHTVVGVQHGVGLRHDDLVATPHARDDELAVCEHRNLGYGVAIQGRIHDDILSDGSMVVLVVSSYLQVGRLHKELAHRHHRQDDAHHAQRISHGTAQGSTAAGKSQLLQSLLGSTQGRRIGSSAAENAHHVGQTHGQQPAQNQGEERSHHDDGHRPQVERNALMSHGAEEVGAYIKSQYINKHGESEALGKLEHILVDRKSEMTGNDAHKEHEGNAERNATHPNLAKGKTQCADKRKYDDALHRRMYIDQSVKPHDNLFQPFISEFFVICFYSAAKVQHFFDRAKDWVLIFGKYT